MEQIYVGNWTKAVFIDTNMLPNFNRLEDHATKFVFTFFRKGCQSAALADLIV